MAKYSLWISDRIGNKICIPMSRDCQTCREKVDLYEIDLLTVSLGKEGFINTLQKSNIVPKDFEWGNTSGYIQYQINQKKHYLPLLFEKDKLLIQILNFQNKYRYQRSKTEGEIINEFKKIPFQSDFSKILLSLAHYRDEILQQMKMDLDLLNDCNISKKFAQKMYSCLQSTDYDEKREYQNDILIDMLSYITFRRLKAMEYACYVNQKLTNQTYHNSSEETERDPDETAFLSENELAMMYGVSFGERNHGNR